MGGPRPEDRCLPISAFVGAEEATLGLLLLAAHKGLGGLLLRGEKGTGKSTLGRGLARILPPAQVNGGCPYGCPADRPELWCEACLEARPEPACRPAPFVTLPLGATEDQVLGTVDLERALRSGERRFEPGLLARASGGVLYVDEVNLLDDHLVDLLLDVAATKVNVVAREGVTVSHPADFLLVGTMNPEEGELRPQLTDRFGLCAEVRHEEDPEQRAEIVARVLAFEADRAAFAAAHAAAEAELASRILRARQLLPAIGPDRSLMAAAARLSLDLGVDGHRADLLAVKASMAAAALEGRTVVEAGDLERVAPLVYAHRIRRRPFDAAALSAVEVRERARSALAGEGAPRKKARGPG